MGSVIAGAHVSVSTGGRPEGHNAATAVDGFEPALAKALEMTRSVAIGKDGARKTKALPQTTTSSLDDWFVGHKVTSHDVAFSLAEKSEIATASAVDDRSGKTERNAAHAIASEGMDNTEGTQALGEAYIETTIQNHKSSSTDAISRTNRNGNSAFDVLLSDKQEPTHIIEVTQGDKPIMNKTGVTSKAQARARADAPSLKKSDADTSTAIMLAPEMQLNAMSPAVAGEARNQPALVPPGVFRSGVGANRHVPINAEVTHNNEITGDSTRGSQPVRVSENGLEHADVQDSSSMTDNIVANANVHLDQTPSVLAGGNAPVRGLQRAQQPESQSPPGVVARIVTPRAWAHAEARQVRNRTSLSAELSSDDATAPSTLGPQSIATALPSEPREAAREESNSGTRNASPSSLGNRASNEPTIVQQGGVAVVNSASNTSFVTPNNAQPTSVVQGPNQAGTGMGEMPRVMVSSTLEGGGARAVIALQGHAVRIAETGTGLRIVAAADAIESLQTALSAAGITGQVIAPSGGGNHNSDGTGAEFVGGERNNGGDPGKRERREQQQYPE